ncbi:MAG: hypothetical protein ACE5Z5_05160 [Candidatus Bathyarchaeia archaeon]
MSAVLSIRVPKQVKDRVKTFRDFNWRGHILSAIEKKLRELEAEKVLEEIDAMNRKLEGKPAPPSWRLIREDRER